MSTVKASLVFTASNSIWLREMRQSGASTRAPPQQVDDGSGGVWLLALCWEQWKL
ncbi:hypothetical protein BT69DRAFT_1282619 [Atractiella rhizophila]|nr:hypothetical protein BT69DRAFT_1282619 [Atractiella rhizophila]